MTGKGMFVGQNVGERTGQTGRIYLLGESEDPYAGYTTKYATFDSATGGDGSSSNPWGYQTAWASATAGQRVYCRGSGTYTLTNTMNAYVPILDPTNSGTSSTNMIVFQRHPDYVFYLNGTGGQSSGYGQAPVLGTNGSNYIVIDGFNLRSPTVKGMILCYTTGSIIRNCDIRGMRNAVNTIDNCNGIRAGFNASAAACFDSVIENNYFDDIGSETTHHNRSAIQTYNSENIYIRYNRIFSDDNQTGAGIYIKDAHAGPVYIHNNWVKATNYTIETCLFSSGGTKDDIFWFNNLIDRSGLGGTDPKLFEGSSTGNTTNEKIYNNTFVDAGTWAIYINNLNGKYSASNPLIFYNNLFWGSVSNGRGSHFVWNYQAIGSQCTPSNYNAYPSGATLYDSNGAKNLTAWNTYTGEDGGSQYVASNPFQDSANDDFRLTNSHALLTAGHEGGVSGGATTYVGAFDDTTNWLSLTGPQ